MNDRNSVKIGLFTVLALLIVGSISYIESTKSGHTSSVGGGEIENLVSNDEKAKLYSRAKEIVAPAGFINTVDGEITIEKLIGKKIILVDFWTYSCINCQRTLPYLNNWYEKYKDSGLVIVGVHTPEFEFEKDYQNVLSATKKYGVQYPVVLDNDYGTWSAYENRYWPRKYLIDIDGYIVYDHIGEGAYEETELKIQELLAERAEKLGLEEMPSVTEDTAAPEGVSVVDFTEPKSPEIYFGATRNEYLGNGIRGVVGEQIFQSPDKLQANILYLEGVWNVTSEYSENKTVGARVIFKYRAKNVNIVASSDTETVIELKLDGLPLAEKAGRDVDVSKTTSTVKINGSDLYELVNDPNGYGEHVLEIILPQTDVRIFTFTFG